MDKICALSLEESNLITLSPFSLPLLHPSLIATSSLNFIQHFFEEPKFLPIALVLPFDRDWHFDNIIFKIEIIQRYYNYNIMI